MKPASATDNLLGFDFGTKRIGVAVGNRLTGTARGIKTITNKDRPDWNTISELVNEWCPCEFIVGLPLNMDGTEQPVTQAAKKFAASLQHRFSIPAYMMDERLSSVEAVETLKNQRNKGRKSKIRSGEKDSEAARVILEDWLNQ